MDMFDNYQNLDSTYSPNNLSKQLEEDRETYTNEVPKKEYDFKGEFTGYAWNYGDTFTFNININPFITVEKDALIYREANEEPLADTEGTFGQMAYNLVDLKCWKCTSVGQTVYEWELQKDFTHPISGMQVEIPKYQFNEGDKAIVTISNFRMKPVHTFETEATDVVALQVTKEVSEKLLRGVYHCTVQIVSGDTVSVIYQMPFHVI